MNPSNHRGSNISLHEDDEDCSDFFPDSEEIFMQDQNLSQTNSEETEIELNVCQVCGKSVKSPADVKKCLHCDLIVCDKCISHGFCINCFIHLKDGMAKWLKLCKFFPYFGFLLVFLAFSNGLTTFIIIEVLIIIVSLIVHYLLQAIIIMRHSTNFEPLWEQTVHSKSFTEKFIQIRTNRYISQEMQTEYLEKQENRKRKMIHWVESKNIYDGVPKPFFINLENPDGSLDEEILFDNPIFPQRKANHYYLTGKKCPQCGQEIEFANFCPECMIKYCNVCQNPNSAYSSNCICGEDLPDLVAEYEIWKLEKKKSSGSLNPSA